MPGVLKAELIKLKRSPALLLAVFLPLLLTLLGTGNYMHYADIWVEKGWNNLYIQVVFWYALLLLPLSITLITMLVAYVEHQGDGWKAMLARPVSRTDIYLSKLVVAILLVGLSMLVLVVTYVLAGKLIGLQQPLPVELVLVQPINGFIGCWPIIAVHLWLAARFPRPLLPAGIGVVTAVLVLFAANSRYGVHLIWTFPQYGLGLAISKAIIQRHGGGYRGQAL